MGVTPYREFWGKTCRVGVTPYREWLGRGRLVEGAVPCRAQYREAYREEVAS